MFFSLVCDVCSVTLCWLLSFLLLSICCVFPLNEQKTSCCGIFGEFFKYFFEIRKNMVCWLVRDGKIFRSRFNTSSVSYWEIEKAFWLYSKGKSKKNLDFGTWLDICKVLSTKNQFLSNFTLLWSIDTLYD